MFNQFGVKDWWHSAVHTSAGFLVTHNIAFEHIKFFFQLCLTTAANLRMRGFRF